MKKKNTTDQDIEKAKQSKAEPKFAVNTEEAQKSLEEMTDMLRKNDQLQYTE